MAETFGWLEVETIAEHLARLHPTIDPYAVRFTELRRLVADLPGFREEPGHPVNERILEEIQRHWIEEREDAADDEE